MREDCYYYKIIIVHELTSNPFDCSKDPNRKIAKDNLYEKLENLIPADGKHECFGTKLTMYQLKDSLNYISVYEVFFRSSGGMPMSEYVESETYRDQAKKELESYFGSQDCEFRQIMIKTLV